ncbi:MarR family winged helix-turn-helix transcriptional regulator [Flexivirga sp. B27]
MTDREVASTRDIATDLRTLARDTTVPPQRRLAAIFHSFDVNRRVVEAKTALTAADMRLLWLLSDDRPRTQREISTELNLEQSTVNRQVNAALREGLIEREAGQHGSAVLSASADGRRCYEADIETLMGVLGSALQALGDGGEEFIVSLATFAEAYRAAMPDVR